MTKSVVALVGISGVGKSTLLRAAAETIQFQHLQASALIKAAKEKQTAETVVTDDLRTADITDNQALLVQGFSDARDPSKTLIVLDGHTVIDTPNGLVTIEPRIPACGKRSRRHSRAASPQRRRAAPPVSQTHRPGLRRARKPFASFQPAARGLIPHS
jgi:ABC-type dipeptide/oligopeptide/nickel transport system ATPase component